MIRYTPPARDQQAAVQQLVVAMFVRAIDVLASVPPRPRLKRWTWHR